LILNFFNNFQGTASEATLVALLSARAKAIDAQKLIDPSKTKKSL
jgi:hypothetical protein